MDVMVQVFAVLCFIILFVLASFIVDIIKSRGRHKMWTDVCLRPGIMTFLFAAILIAHGMGGSGNGEKKCFSEVKEYFPRVSAALKNLLEDSFNG